MQNAPDHTGDVVEIGDHLDVAEAHGTHNTQHVVGLADAHLEVQPSAGTQGAAPVLADGAIEVQAVGAAFSARWGS